MSSWIWMKGCHVAIADPIPGDDPRPSVKDLIEEHKVTIAAAKQEMGTALDPSKHDDLWILRFVLSHKNKLPKIIKAMHHTLEFRREHNLDQIDLRQHPPQYKEHRYFPASARYMKYAKEDLARFVVPDVKRHGVVQFLSMAAIDQHNLVANVDEADWLEVFTLVSEFTHQWCDYLTRTTGRLTKNVRIVTLEGLHLSKISNEMNRRDGKTMGSMEDCYPQMLQSIFLCDAPAWVQIPWQIVRPIMPKRVVEKMDFLNPTKNKKHLDKILSFIDVEFLPEHFGGDHKSWPVDIPLPKTS